MNLKNIKIFEGFPDPLTEPDLFNRKKAILFMHYIIKTKQKQVPQAFPDEVWNGLFEMGKQYVNSNKHYKIVMENMLSAVTLTFNWNDKNEFIITPVGNPVYYFKMQYIEKLREFFLQL